MDQLVELASLKSSVQSVQSPTNLPMKPAYDPQSLTWIQSVTRADTIIIYVAILLLFVIFLISFGFGVNSTWYNSLQFDNVNVWLVRSAWVVFTIISYIGLWLLWGNRSETLLLRNLGISSMYLVSSFLILAWAFTLYQAENIALSFWFAFVLFIYQFWISVYIYNINKIAGILQIPIVLMYFYLVFWSVNFAFLNNTPI